MSAAAAHADGPISRAGQRHTPVAEDGRSAWLGLPEQANALPVLRRLLDQPA